MASILRCSSLADSFRGTCFVTVHALEAGSLTLPAAQFIDPCEPGLRLTKPSLSFLIQHTDSNGKLTRLLFDLGIRRVLGEYPLKLQRHLLSRQPVTINPDVKASIERGGLTTEDIDIVILSHVHWDHVGRPKDFPCSLFVVGSGALELLKNGSPPGRIGESHSNFEFDLLPLNRTIELSSTEDCAQIKSTNEHATLIGGHLARARWKPLLHFPAAIDVFGDQSLFIVDAPGHLQGHINLLARTGPEKWVYLAGDACHDRRLLTGDRSIAEWKDEYGAICCIHVNKTVAEHTLGAIRELEVQHGNEVEVILAHDDGWYERKENKVRFWPGAL